MAHWPPPRPGPGVEVEKPGGTDWGKGRECAMGSISLIELAIYAFWLRNLDEAPFTVPPKIFEATF